MRAIVLAGGLGTRLGGVCKYLPKPLVPVGDMAVAEILLQQLVAAGFHHVTFAVGHRASLVMAYFSNGAIPDGVTVDFSRETEPLGTMGPLCLIDDLPDNFLVVNGDVLTDLNFGHMMHQHRSNRMPLTVATHRREVVSDFGVLHVEDGRVVQFAEKPISVSEVSMGAYVLSGDAVAAISRGRPFGFDDLVISLLSTDWPIGAFAHDGYWLDIGRPADYERANEEFATMKSRLLPESPCKTP